MGKVVFIATYSVYSCETASSFVADSRRPSETLRFLSFAAWLIPPVYLGGSWVLMQLATQPEMGDNVYLNFFSGSQPLLGPVSLIPCDAPDRLQLPAKLRHCSFHSPYFVPTCLGRTSFACVHSRFPTGCPRTCSHINLFTQPPLPSWRFISYLLSREYWLSSVHHGNSPRAVAALGQTRGAMAFGHSVFHYGGSCPGSRGA